MSITQQKKLTKKYPEIISRNSDAN